ncbi:MAG: hypothetical protein NZT61_01870 [Deltaproteobacteria bacterium]|nr:hypothetical protein [Deltaproteobacteria bacterium]MCX7952340.1 hypothetical protein [Deltaproteobacteria bacterium]
MSVRVSVKPVEKFDLSDTIFGVIRRLAEDVVSLSGRYGGSTPRGKILGELTPLQRADSLLKVGEVYDRVKEYVVDLSHFSLNRSQFTKLTSAEPWVMFIWVNVLEQITNSRPRSTQRPVAISKSYLDRLFEGRVRALVGQQTVLNSDVRDGLTNFFIRVLGAPTVSIEPSNWEKIAKGASRLLRKSLSTVIRLYRPEDVIEYEKSRSRNLLWTELLDYVDKNADFISLENSNQPRDSIDSQEEIRKYETFFWDIGFKVGELAEKNLGSDRELKGVIAWAKQYPIPTGFIAAQLICDLVRVVREGEVVVKPTIPNMF